MMAPTQIFVSNDVTYVMEISKNDSCDEVLKQTLLDDCGIESTIVLGDGSSLPDGLIKHDENITEVSSEIVTILPDDTTNYSMLSADENRQSFLTCNDEDLATSSFGTMPMLSVTGGNDFIDGNSEDWSEVGETLELSDDVDDVILDKADCTENQILQPVIVQPPSSDNLDDTQTFCLLINGHPYNLVPSHQFVVAEQNSENEVNGKLNANDNKMEPNNSSSSKGKKLARKKRNHFCFEPGCNRSYTSLHHLKVHMRKHQGFLPYLCPVEGCGKAFAEIYSCSIHIRTHTGEKPYKCTECSKGFKTSGDLLKHMRTHTGERPFKCPVEGCDKAFTTADIRKIHIRSHTGEKPFVCHISGCERKFSSSTNCKNHMRIHTGEKPYVCPVEGCTSKFTEYSSLYKHRNVHKQKENQSFLGGKQFKVSSTYPTKTSKNRRTSVKKIVKNAKETTNSLLSMHDDEPENLDNDGLNMTLEDDNFEIYQLILRDDLKM